MAKDPKAAPAAEEKPAGNPKKKLIIIIVAVLVLLIGGGAGWYFMQPKEDPKKVQKHGEHSEEGDHEEGADHEEDGDHDEHADEDEEEESGGHGEAPAGPAFLPLETFTVNLQPDPDERFLQMDISLQFKTAAQADKMKALMPALRNRILLLLSSKLASEINTLEGKEALSAELLEAVNKPYEKKGKKQKVQGVFFTSFVIQ
jgi:flagellar FliL protein